MALCPAWRQQCPYVVTGGISEKRYVETGLDDGERIAVLSGLNEGESVVVSGSASDGASVQIVED